MTDRSSAAIREEVIESMEQSAEVYGLSRSAGRVFGVLYFAEAPMSIPELVEETGYAKSTISNVTRQLTRIGLLHRRSSEGGGRRVEFEPETELWFVIQDVLQQYLHREITATQRTLRRSRRELEAGTDGIEAARMDELQASYGQLQELVEKAMAHSMSELIEAIEAYEDTD